MQLRLYGKGPFPAWSRRCFSLCGCVLQEKPCKFICNIFAPFNLGHNSAFSCSNLATSQCYSPSKSNLINQRAALNVVFIYAISGKHRNTCYSWKQCTDLIWTKGEKGTHLLQRHCTWSLREPGSVCRFPVATAHTASIFSWMGAIYKVPTDKSSSKDTLNTFPSFNISAFCVPIK